MAIDRISASAAAPTRYGGSTAAESPEWIPASSMCSRMPATTARSPSAIRSRSSSMAPSRKRSRSTGCPSETSAARRM